MESSIACPDHAWLDAFRQGNLDLERLDSIGQHAASCGRCLAVLATLTDENDSDSIVINLRRDFTSKALVQQDAIRRIEVRAQGIPFGFKGESGNTGKDQDSTRATPTPGSLPTILGLYQLVRPLGRGGMGLVYEAVHARLKKRVAIKILPPERVNAPDAVARFHREMEALGELSHPNIVCATDAGEADGHHYLVMECVDGLDLAALTSQHGPLAVCDAAELIRQAAIGLQYVYEHQRVHRDIKPANLMVTALGDLKILDLGLALLCVERPEEDELTSDGQAMGTADYTAPEQWLDSHRVDIRADIYSLGCTFYKLLAGRAPFSGPRYDTRLKKRAAHINSTVPPIADRHIPDPLLGHLTRMLAKDAQHRFATPAAVADALTPFTTGCDLRRLVQIGRQERRNDGALIQSSLSQRAPSLPVPRRQRRAAWSFALLAAAMVVAGGAATTLLVNHLPQSQVSAPPPPMQEPAKAKGWRPIAHDAPRALHWPVDTRNSRWHWDAAQAELQMLCSEDGYIQLGEASRSHFGFEVAVFQMNWGGAGIFFGHQPDILEGKACDRFQRIVLQRSADNGRGGHLLVWSVTRSWRGGGGGTTSDALTVPLGEIGDQDQRLTIRVEDGILQSVRWNSVELMPRFCESPAAKLGSGLLTVSAKGRFGVYCGRTNAFFRKPQYQFSGEP